MAMKGYVHSFESLAAVDGDGLRCAVFLSGCPLRCIYCHNPDTWDRLSGTPTEPDALVKKIARYKTYFGEDGGVTFSGGEPLLQADFIAELIPLLEKEKIGYIIDTSGCVPLSDSVKDVLRSAQSVLLDLKFWDKKSYFDYTRGDIDAVLNTLKFLDSIGKKTTIRTVIVPGINDSEGVLKKYVAIIKAFSCVEKYELLGFHTMGFFKYEKLGIENKLSNTEALSPERKNALQNFVNSELKQ